MLSWDEIVKTFDEYSRRARLYPAILALAPLVITLAVLFPGIFAEGPIQAAIAIIVVLGGIYWVSNVARAKGKALEPRLISDWGGLPTTILLRHRDPTVDPYTKARYHAKLHELVPGLTLPSAAEEAAQSTDADLRYQSAVRRLLELRRGDEFALVHKENAIYGFWRNLLGLKPLALALSLISLFLLAGVLLASMISTPATAEALAAVSAAVPVNWALWFAAAVDAGAVLVWLISVNQHTVRQAGNTYATALLRTLDA